MCVGVRVAVLEGKMFCQLFSREENALGTADLLFPLMDNGGVCAYAACGCIMCGIVNVCEWIYACVSRIQRAQPRKKKSSTVLEKCKQF